MKLNLAAGVLEYRRITKRLDEYLHEKYFPLIDEKIRYFLTGGRSFMGVVTFEASKYKKPDMETAARAELSARLATIIKDIIDKDVRRGVQISYLTLQEADIWKTVYYFLDHGVFDESDIKMARNAYDMIKKEVEFGSSKTKPDLQTYVSIINAKNGNFVAHFTRKVSNERIADGVRCLANGWQIIDDINDENYNLERGRYTLPSMDKKLSRAIALDYFKKAEDVFYDGSPLLRLMPEVGKIMVALPSVEKSIYLLTNPKAFAILLSKNHN